MRPLFLPDGSMLLGQTGRGWQAKGGHVASLQRIQWVGTSVPASIFNVSARSDGFEIKLTKPLALADKALPTELLRLSSWVYRDAPDYGSETMDERQESVESLTLSDDKTSLFVKLASVKQSVVHPQQTARVYHFALDAQALFDLPAPRLMDAYYTLYRFPAP